MVEQPDAAAEQARGDAELDLVEQLGPEQLLRRDGRATETSLSPAASCACSTRPLDAVGDELHLRAPLALGRSLVGDDEDRHVDRVAPAQPPAMSNVRRPLSICAGSPGTHASTTGMLASGGRSHALNRFLGGPALIQANRRLAAPPSG